MHNLLRLLELSEEVLSDDKYTFLIEMNIYNLEGRYPGADVPLPDNNTVADMLKKAEEIITWFKSLLKP